MTRILKTGIKAQEKRKNERATTNAVKPRKSMITLDDLRTNLVLSPTGQRVTVLAMPDQEFCDWFDAFADSVLAFAKSGDGAPLLIGAAKDGIQVIPLDEEARMYFVNEVYRTPTYRRSGIEIFVCDEEVSA